MSLPVFLPSLSQAQAIVSSNENFSEDVVEVDGHRLHMFRYSLPGWMDFDEPIRGDRSVNASEMRGTVFVVAPDGTQNRFLMLPKFFGLNETRGCMIKDLAGKEIAHVGDKLDGSLVRFLPVGARLLAKTKTSISGPHAERALELLDATPGLRAFVERTIEDGVAAIFELVTPEFKILLGYPDAGLRLLQLRREDTGAFVEFDDYEPVRTHGVATTPSLAVTSLDELTARQRTVSGTEGWVVRFTDGSMVKVKTVWYEDMHDLNFERNRSDKKILQSVLNDTIDDAIAMLSPTDPDRPRFEQARDLVRNEFHRLRRDTLDLMSRFEGDPADKDAKAAFARANRSHPCFGYAMFSLANPGGERLEQHLLQQMRGRCKNERDATAFLRDLMGDPAAAA